MAMHRRSGSEQVLDIPHGIPSHDTFRRVLARLDPDEFTHCFLTWTQALSERSAGEIVLISQSNSNLCHVL